MENTVRIPTSNKEAILQANSENHVNFSDS